jgi:transcriptional regulator, AraC family
MTTENLYPPYHIEFAELEESPVSAHKHNFFELVYIISGRGKQIINGNEFNYIPGQMFLITPQDNHSFEVKEVTQFLFLQFNDVYIKAQSRPENSDKDRIKRLEFILHNASHQPGCILCNPGDKVLVKALVQSIGTESINRNIYHREMIDQLVNTMITIVARNIALKLPEKIDDKTDQHTIKFINYIQENIFSPESLRASVMSNKLGIAQGYLGRYFKKHVGESIQQYITNYKLKLVETRLLHSKMRVNEIVSELGFTDESHLNRLFKKYRGLSPTEFRKKANARDNYIEHH